MAAAPLDQALLRLRVVRPVIQELADAVADVESRPHVLVPDLGPRAVMDQLTVTAYDASQAGLDPRRSSNGFGAPSAEALVDDGHALAASDAHRLEAELGVPPPASR